MSVPSAAKASSMGAKTVNGPSPLRVSARSAAPTAAVSVWVCSVMLAVSTMSSSGRMTPSMRWITPFSATTSVAMMFAPSTLGVSPERSMVTC